MTARRCALLLAALAGCSRASAPAPTAARDAGEGTAEGGSTAPAPPATASVPRADDATAESLAPTRPGAGEGERTTLERLEDDPQLAPAFAKLRDHFGGDAHGPFLEQRAALSNGWVAALVSLPDESAPAVVVVDRDRLVWAKDKPTAGIVTPVGPAALFPYTDGGGALAVCVPGASIVAARVWADDANPFAEIALMTGGGCDAVSAAYWPGEGWVVVAAAGGGRSRAQLLREGGTLAWGEEGVPVGEPWRAPAPATLLVDTPASVMLLQHASGAAGGGDHLIAQRYDRDGAPLWSKPLDLGVVWHVSPAGERVRARTARPGVVRVELPRGTPTRPIKWVQIDTAGDLRWGSD